MRNFKILILVATVIVFVSLNSFGQAKKEVPANINTAFAKKFPTATKVKWGKENAKEWEAEFMMNNKEYSANYDNAGNLIETEYEISTKEIPAAVKATLDKEFSSYKIDEAALSETKTGKFYEFDLKKDGKKMEVVIDITGKIIKKDEAKKKGDDKD